MSVKGMCFIQSPGLSLLEQRDAQGNLRMYKPIMHADYGLCFFLLTWSYPSSFRFFCLESE